MNAARRRARVYFAMIAWLLVFCIAWAVIEVTSKTTLQLRNSLICLTVAHTIAVMSALVALSKINNK